MNWCVLVHRAANSAPTAPPTATALANNITTHIKIIIRCCSLAPSLIFIVKKILCSSQSYQLDVRFQFLRIIFGTGAKRTREHGVRVLYQFIDGSMVRCTKVFFCCCCQFSAFNSGVSTLNKWAHQSIRIIIRTAVFYSSKPMESNSYEQRMLSLSLPLFLPLFHFCTMQHNIALLAFSNVVFFSRLYVVLIAKTDFTRLIAIRIKKGNIFSRVAASNKNHKITI